MMIRGFNKDIRITNGVMNRNSPIGNRFRLRRTLLSPAVSFQLNNGIHLISQSGKLSSWGLSRKTSSKIHTLSGHLNPVVSVANASPRRQYSLAHAIATPENDSLKRIEKIRNLAIIAHVDHGKTSLVDQLLRQSGAANITDDNTRVMDSNDLERERGITILSKSTSIQYKGYRINLVDTPGHADFGGEVERVLSMVDGVCLVVCASDGPMTQTKFVLSKALAKGLKPIVVMNKIDRPTAQPDRVEEELLELFLSLDASDSQLDYPLLYASAKEGWATTSLEDASQAERRSSITPLLDSILENVPAPSGEEDKPFRMLVTQIETDPYVGKCYLGRVHSGTLAINDKVKALDKNGKIVCEGKCVKIFLRHGLSQSTMDVASAGDIVSIAGLDSAHVNDTICGADESEPLPIVEVDPPTISMFFNINDSPVAGKEGKHLTSQALRDRLFKETETNVSLQVLESGDGFEVKGRGELQMGILIETMRREGYELSVSPPRVLCKSVADSSSRGSKSKTIMEPMEEVIVDVDHNTAGTVIEKMSKRKGVMKSYNDHGDGARLVFHIPSRGLLGYPAEFKYDTAGEGILNHCFIGYEPYQGTIEKTRKGSILCTASGAATAYALASIEARGRLFIKPGDTVYPGMVIGEHSREQDIEVNPVRAKQVTNVRSVMKDDAIRLTPPQIMTLEQMLTYVQDDEVIEVTPSALRSRKKILDSSQRRRQSTIDYVLIDE